MSEVFVLPTIDGDPGETFPNSRFSHLAGTKWICDEKNHALQYQRVMDRLLALLEECGLQGKVTWFLNEGDVGWSTKYKTLIRDMIGAGYEIGLHTHVGSIFRDAGLETLSSSDEVYEIMKRTKEDLEGCLGKACLSHRFGCYYQTKTLYSLVKRMVYASFPTFIPAYSFAISRATSWIMPTCPSTSSPGDTTKATGSILVHARGTSFISRFAPQVLRGTPCSRKGSPAISTAEKSRTSLP